MRISVVTDSQACVNGFIPLGRSRNHCVESRPVSEFTSVLKDGGRDHYVYLDITNLAVATIRARAKQLQGVVGQRFGFVDRNGTLTDVAEGFQRGASDYVDGPLLRNGLTSARFSRVVEFALIAEPEEGPEQEPELSAAEESRFEPLVASGVGQYLPSGRSWDEVRQGQEYTFQMLYVGLDHVKEMRRKSSEDLLRALRRSLQSILTRTFAGVGGRTWVWKEDDGVLLCPFDGERLTALVPAMRLVLNRVLMNIEQFSVTTPISWRMGLHVGNTTYQASGSTSAIVSESLNFVFHLGERSLKPGKLAVTEPALALAPEKTQRCFVKAAPFESTDLYLLRDLA